MFSVFWNIASFLITIGILISVHEWGHFWVARRCGVHVERFSIGFGRVIWCYTDSYGTEYVVSMIPLGGYVKMLNEQKVNTIFTKKYSQALKNKNILQRAAIIIAGPISNFLFTILTYWVVLIIGVPTYRPVIDKISPQSIAEKAKILPGMEFKSIGGIETPDWESVRLALITNLGNIQTEINVAPFGTSQRMLKILDLRQWNLDVNKQDPVLSLGIIPYSSKIEPVLTKVQVNSAGQRAGLHVGDKIVKIDNQQLDCWETLVQRIHDNPQKIINLEVERHNLPIFLTLIPDKKKIEKDQWIGFAGITPNILSLSEEYKIIHQYGWLEALHQAIDKTWHLIQLTVNILDKLIIGKINLNNLNGPISIAQGAGTSISNGFLYYLMFLGLMSTNLGIINLFPFPILDGGHLLFLVIEKLKKKPISERVQDFSYRIGSIILMLLMSLALFNDFSRLI